ncbi:MAG: restriction endonuclease subunit S [Nitrospirae bacterium]|nr:restriction endonuclease subunit S [Nitrospirota bacterium]
MVNHSKHIEEAFLPKDWDYIPISKVVLKTQQRDPSKKPDEEIKYVDVSGVNNELFQIQEYSILKGENAPSRARKIIEADDVIFATVRPTLKRVAIVESDLHKELCSTGYCVLKANKSLVAYRFLYYYLLTDFYINEIAQLQRGASYPAVRDSDVKGIKIPLPPYSEQQSISHILTLMQSAIQKQEQIIRTTTELKNALMQKLFTEGTKGEAQKQTEVGLIPASWEVKKIENVGFNFLGGGTPSTKNDKYWIGDIHWTTSKRLATDKIYLEDGERRISKIGLGNSSSNVVPKNNLIVSTRVTVGKVAINLVDMAISQDLTGILINRKKYCLEFLAYQILTERVQRIFEAQKRGATIKGITREDLKDIRLAIPKTKIEQEEVANSLMVLDRKLQHHQTKKQTLMALFRSMLHQLMTGQIRVKDLQFKKV